MTQPNPSPGPMPPLAVADLARAFDLVRDARLLVGVTYQPQTEHQRAESVRIFWLLDEAHRALRALVTAGVVPADQELTEYVEDGVTKVESPC